MGGGGAGLTVTAADAVVEAPPTTLAVAVRSVDGRIHRDLDGPLISVDHGGDAVDADSRLYRGEDGPAHEQGPSGTTVPADRVGDRDVQAGPRAGDRHGQRGARRADHPHQKRVVGGKLDGPLDHPTLARRLEHHDGLPLVEDEHGQRDSAAAVRAVLHPELAALFGLAGGEPLDRRERQSRLDHVLLGSERRCRVHHGRESEDQAGDSQDELFRR